MQSHALMTLLPPVASAHLCQLAPLAVAQVKMPLPAQLPLSLVQ